MITTDPVDDLASPETSERVRTRIGLLRRFERRGGRRVTYDELAGKVT
jgi:hypothetical protein